MQGGSEGDAGGEVRVTSRMNAAQQAQQPRPVESPPGSVAQEASPPESWAPPHPVAEQVLSVGPAVQVSCTFPLLTAPHPRKPAPTFGGRNLSRSGVRSA